jgi:GDP-4-dehydro-6-deoxy-D-mannose reductase
VIATDIQASPPDDPAGAEGPARLFPALSMPDKAVYRQCDLRNAEAVNELVRGLEPQAVFHLAAQSSAAESFEDPKGTLEVNVFGTLHMLEAMKMLARSSSPAGEPRKFLSVGSSDEYGQRSPEEMPLGEDTPVEPVSPYAVSKTAQTMLALQYCKAYDLDVIVTRSFSHTGPGQTVRFALPSFARQCAEIKTGSREPVMRVGNTDVIRDFLDVRDVVRAYRLLIEKGTPGRIYNICSGSGLKIAEALDTLIEKTAVSIRIETDPDLLRPVDVPVLIGNNERLLADTGWNATISTDEMLGDLAMYWERRLEASTA